MPTAQGSYSNPPISNAVSHPDYFSNHELYILQEASSILQCPIRQLIGLDRASRSQTLQPSPIPASYTAPFKRQRLSTDLATMSSPGDSHVSRSPNHEMPEYQQHVRDPDNHNNSYFSQYFTNFSICPPCTTCDPPGWYPSHVADTSGTSAELG